MAFGSAQSTEIAPAEKEFVDLAVQVFRGERVDAAVSASSLFSVSDIKCPAACLARRGNIGEGILRDAVTANLDHPDFRSHFR